MPTIHATDRTGVTREVEAETGLSLMENLRDKGGMDIAAICGGMASCATCHVHVDVDWMDRLPPAEPDEIELVEFTEAYDEARSRLSCQIRVTEDLDGLRLTLAPEA
ncbi:2Fe-2S iron-sulfur cluster-binding protein [Roseibacterium sp. SDUM158016]|jgi:2Fe-2S ferredoxin|uniref:2Fe-2S iron-sulfur cluster-binding protein n=1 Tax=Roseicyclus sediminis TaxID=2980997 RepID=UPI0021D237E1|nr:2Fe-2S iron-sulfur cluster-binding protein [Roseibacterium sp. SDUM158016]MCU4652107.1 2Fe-2S iron-sulfur cluster-binding protein [Roseibacterium sp. SDUM158016]